MRSAGVRRVNRPGEPSLGEVEKQPGAPSLDKAKKHPGAPSLN